MSKLLKSLAIVLALLVNTSYAGPFDPPTKEEIRSDRKAACENGFLRITVGCKPLVLFEAMNEQYNCLAHAVDAADFLHDKEGFDFKDLHIIVGKTNGDPDGDNHAWLMVHIGSKDWALDQGGLCYWWNTVREVCPENVCLAAYVFHSLPNHREWT